MHISPVNTIRGEVSVPPDKSITHRAIILASLADGTSTIHNALHCCDTRATIMAMRSMGIRINDDGDALRITGNGMRGLMKPQGAIDCMNSGTTMRLLAGLLAAQDFSCTLTGDASLRSRPMSRICKPLRQMGAHIFSATGEDYAPITVTGGKLRGIQHVNSAASAQVKSALMLAGMYSGGKTTIYEPVQSRNHTEILMEQFGVPLQCTHMNNSKGRTFGDSVTISAVDHLNPQEIWVPGDFSSAAYLIAAAACIPESDLIIRNVGINPTRTGFLVVARAMGMDISVINEHLISGEYYADLRICYRKLKAIDVPSEIIPSLIDEIPILAVIATQAAGETRIRNISELRVKETDRVNALVTNLTAMGASIRVEDECLIITSSPLHGAEIHSYGDHRIAMAMTVASMIAHSESLLYDTDCTDISFPEFYETLSSVCY